MTANNEISSEITSAKSLNEEKIVKELFYAY